MKNKTDSKIVILGAGLTGLAAAHHLKKGYRLVEKESRVGGLARTEGRDGFLFDSTGHWLHLRNPVTKRLVGALLPGRMRTHERHAAIYSKGVYTRYPFQANLAGLPAEVAAECLIGYINAFFNPPARKGRTFKRWIIDTFGPGIAKHFLLPYNEKIWTIPPDGMASGYAERYIPIPRVEEIVRGTLGLSQEALGYNATFLYPDAGGIEVLPRAFAARLTIPAETGLRPVAIDCRGRTVTFDDGSTTAYSSIVSSIPLPDLVELVGGAPDAVVRAGRRLRATRVTYFNVAARGYGPHRFSWVYYPEPAFPFYRIGSYSQCAPQTAPAGAASFYVEYSHVDEVDTGALRERALDDMVRTGLLRAREDVLFAEMRFHRPAYVIYDHHYEPAMRTILPFLKAARIIPAGRYGAWGYSAMEDAMLDGIAAATQAAASR